MRMQRDAVTPEGADSALHGWMQESPTWASKVCISEAAIRHTQHGRPLQAWWGLRSTHCLCATRKRRVLLRFWHGSHSRKRRPTARARQHGIRMRPYRLGASPRIRNAAPTPRCCSWSPLSLERFGANVSAADDKPVFSQRRAWPLI